MSGWGKLKLGDTLDKIIGGGTPSKSMPEYWNGDIFWCSVKDMSDDRFSISSTEDKISSLGLANSATNLVKAGTVITATRMGLGRAFINKVDMAINQDLKALYPNEKIDNKFLLWTIINKRAEIDSLGTGATVKGITLDTLKSIEINLPPLPTQRRIASILSAYDDLIENNLKRIKLLEELAQRTYEEWFVKFRINGEQLPVDEKTGLPVGWERKPLGYFFKVITGKKDANYGTPDGEYPFFTCSKDPIKSPNFSFNASAILLAGNGEFNVKIYRGKFEAYQRTYVLIPDQEHDLLLLYRAIYRNLNLLTGGSKGSVVKYLTKDMIENFEIIYPRKELLGYYNEIQGPLQSKLEILLKQNQHLKTSRDILLPRLMNGKIKVE